MQSVKYVYRGIEQALEQRYELVHRSSEYTKAAHDRQEMLLEEFLLSCDVLVGAMDILVLKTRERIGKPIPMVLYLLGAMSRGGISLVDVIPYIRSTDVLIGNCIGD